MTIRSAYAWTSAGRPECAGRDRVLVVIEPHEQRLGDGRGQRMEAVEGGRRQPHQRRLLVVEHVGDGPLAQLGMTMGAGVFDAAIEQPGVQLLIARKTQPRGEEPLAYEPNLVLNLSLLPARGRGACGRLDEIMAAHLEEPTVEPALLAEEDRVHRRRHIIVDAARADPAKEGKRSVHGRRTPSPASRVDRPPRRTCGCGKA